MSWNHEAYRLSTGAFRAFTDIGCYPLFYVTKDGGELCAKCATADGQLTDPHDPQWFLVGADVHWEGEPIVCAHCGDEIAPAYPEDVE